MKTSVMTVAVLMMVLVLGACTPAGGASSGGGSTSGGSPVISRSGSSRVDTAVKIAKAVEANPDRAEAVLRENGMTADEFEDLMYDIAEDPAMSEEFNARMGR